MLRDHHHELPSSSSHAASTRKLTEIVRLDTLTSFAGERDELANLQTVELASWCRKTHVPSSTDSGQKEVNPTSLRWGGIRAAESNAKGSGKEESGKQSCEQQPLSKAAKPSQIACRLQEPQ